MIKVDLEALTSILVKQTSRQEPPNPWRSRSAQVNGMRACLSGEASGLRSAYLSLLRNASGVIHIEGFSQRRNPETLWCWLPPRGGASIQEISTLLAQESVHGLSWSFYEPIDLDGKIWRAFDSPWLLLPRHLEAFIRISGDFNSSDFLVINAKAEDDQALRWLKTPDFLSPAELAAELVQGIDPFLDRSIVQPVTSPALISAPEWVRPYHRKCEEGILFLDSESELDQLTWILEKGSSTILKSLSRWVGLTDSGQSVTAWVGHPETLVQQLRSMKGLVSSGRQVEFFTRYADITSRARTEVWLPTDMTMWPLPPPQTLIDWVVPQDTPSGALMLWIYPVGEGVKSCLFKHSPSRLSSHVELFIQEQVTGPINPLEGIVPLSTTLSILPASKPAQPHSVLFKTEREEDAITSAQAKTSHTIEISNMPRETNSRQEERARLLQENSSNLPAEPENDLIELDKIKERAQEEKVRDALRLATFQQVEVKRSPRERAEDWLSSLPHVAQELISGELSPLQWSAFASRLWTLGKQHQALNALSWAVLEDFLGTNMLRSGAKTLSIKPSAISPLDGWGDRLSHALVDELPRTTWQRRALRSLWNLQSIRRSGDEAPDQLLHDKEAEQLERCLVELDHNEPIAPLLIWLCTHVWTRDQLVLSRRADHVKRLISSGLNSQLIDPYLIPHLLSDLRETRLNSSLNSPEKEQIDHDLFECDSPQTRVRRWILSLCNRLLSELNRHKRDGEDLYEQELLIVMIHGLRSAFEPELKAPQAEVLPREILLALWSVYQPLELGQQASSKGSFISQLMSEPLLKTWSLSSSLQWTRVEASALLCSHPSRAQGNPSPIRIAESTSSLVPKHILRLPLRDAMFALRAHTRIVMNYHSLREILHQAVISAIHAGDQEWLVLCVGAISEWVNTLANTPSAPHEMAARIDLDRILILAQREDGDEVIHELRCWISRWMASRGTIKSWRVLRGLSQDLATTGLEQLSAFLNPLSLIELSEAVVQTFDESAHSLPEEERSLYFEVESASLRALFAVRCYWLSRSSNKRDQLLRTRHQRLHDLAQALCRYGRRSSELAASNQLINRGTGLLTHWCEQLLFYTPDALLELRELLLVEFSHLPIQELTFAWLLIERSVFATPLFAEGDDDRLTLWLRIKERQLRAAWEYSLKTIDELD